MGIERHALTVLRAGVDGGDETAERTARDIANVLVSKGYRRFEALIGGP